MVNGYPVLTQYSSLFRLICTRVGTECCFLMMMFVFPSCYTPIYDAHIAILLNQPKSPYLHITLEEFVITTQKRVAYKTSSNFSSTIAHKPTKCPAQFYSSNWLSWFTAGGCNLITNTSLFLTWIDPRHFGFIMLTAIYGDIHHCSEPLLPPADGSSVTYSHDNVLGVNKNKTHTLKLVHLLSFSYADRHSDSVVFLSVSCDEGTAIRKPQIQYR